MEPQLTPLGAPSWPWASTWIFDPRRRAFDARQHQVDNNFGHVVLTGGDEHLAAADLVGAVGLRLGAGTQQAEVRTTVGFGQAHGAAPAAGDHRWQQALLQGFVSVLAEGADGASGANALAHAAGDTPVRVEHYAPAVALRGRRVNGRILLRARL